MSNSVRFTKSGVGAGAGAGVGLSAGGEGGLTVLANADELRSSRVDTRKIIETFIFDFFFFFLTL